MTKLRGAGEAAALGTEKQGYKNEENKGAKKYEKESSVKMRNNITIKSKGQLEFHI